jgi:hypothetical protein
MMTRILSIVAGITTASLPAQCLFQTVTTQSIGPSCNFGSTGFCAIVSMPSTLTTTLDTPNCKLIVQVNQFEGCGASVPLRLLVLGTQQVAVSLPEFGPGCMLYVAPMILLAATTGPFSLDLPPGVASMSFLEQGAALSHFPFTTPDVLTFTDGLAVSLQ